MKVNIEAIQAGLDKVAQVQARQQALRDELNGLTPKILNLTTAAAGGDAKAASQLTMGKARAELLPKDMDGAAGDYQNAIGELRSLMTGVSSGLYEAIVEENERIEKEAQAFLAQYMDNPYAISEMIREIKTNSARTQRLDGMRRVFSGSAINIPTNEQVMAKARYAVEKLQGV
jgi:hypothetical protein